MPGGWTWEDVAHLTTNDLRQLDQAFALMPLARLQQYVNSANLKTNAKRSQRTRSRSPRTPAPRPLSALEPAPRWPAITKSAPSILKPSSEAIDAAFTALRSVRQSKDASDGSAILEALKVLEKVENAAMNHRWPSGCPNLPMARAKWMANMAQQTSAEKVRANLEEEGIYTEFCA